ncbi:MAG: GTPase [Promethearchaeota archaeon]
MNKNKKEDYKLVMVGRAGTGKTSLRKVVFEGKDPIDLLLNPLEPTKTVDSNVYSFLNISFSIFDTPGQEMEYLLNEDEHLLRSLADAKVIIYVMDYMIYLKFKESIFKDIKKIAELLEKHAPEANLVLFLNKIDIMTLYELQVEIGKIEKDIRSRADFPLFFTSIYPYLLFYTYHAFSEVLSIFSKDFTLFKQILDDEINNKGLSNTIAFISDEQNCVFAHSLGPFSKTFKLTQINRLITIPARYYSLFKELNDDNDEICEFSMKTRNDMKICTKLVSIPDFTKIFITIITLNEDIATSELIENIEESIMERFNVVSIQ